MSTSLPLRPLAVAALALALSCGGAVATERSDQKAAAEAQRAGLQQKLTALKRDISRTENAKGNAADTLAESEQAISSANRALYELAAEQNKTALKLTQLEGQHAALAATADLKKAQLAKLLRQQYVAGNEDRLKLLLSGDDPNRINRDLQMMTYVSQAQARLLLALRTDVQAVEANQVAAQQAKADLADIAAEQLQQKAVLEQEKKRRAVLLASLSQRLVAQRKEAGNLARDEQRMAGLVDKLSQLIKEQAAAAAAQRRQQQLAQAALKAQAEAEAKNRALAAQSERQRPAGSGRTADSGAPKLAVAPKVEASPAPEPVLGAAAPDGAFAALRGQLRAPVAGKLGAKFGSKRGDGPSWKGVFIRAAEGSEIKAVAAGRVVFAEWLRGFGNLLIIDHGGQYMSIYGNNQALLKRAGDAVKSGDAIASAGNSGGNEESGLYFEMRHQGRAIDPADWVKF